jgi:hypothetical protein
MRKKNSVLWALLLIAMFALTSGGCGGSSSDDALEFSGGSGTITDPWQIATAEQLDNARNHLDGNFILTRDIDLSSYENWAPIGVFKPASDAEEDAENPDLTALFSGTFDGDGHIISNIKISQPESTAVGLFGCAYGGFIRNLVVENVDVTGFFLVGCVVGFQGSELENVILRGNNKVQGLQGIGGIAGISLAKITNCTAVADVKVLNNIDYGIYGACGGILAGGSPGSQFINCRVIGGSVTAEGDNIWSLGGLCGGGRISMPAEFTDCSVNNVTITALGADNRLVGGLVGFTGDYDENQPTQISNCTVTGVLINVSGTTTRIGGLLGGSSKSSNFGETDNSFPGNPSRYAVTNCSASGAITGGNEESVGSIVGYAYKSTVENCTSSVTRNSGSINQVGLEDNN